MTSPNYEERSAVLALLAAVKYSKDDEEEAGFAACWAENARLEVISNDVARDPVEGRDAILTFYQGVWRSGGHGLGSERETHVAEHPHIVRLIDGRLLARHTVSFFNWREDRPRLVGYGSFRDEIVLEAGDWRIGRRTSRLWRRR